MSRPTGLSRHLCYCGSSLARLDIFDYIIYEMILDMISTRVRLSAETRVEITSIIDCFNIFSVTNQHHLSYVCL